MKRIALALLLLATPAAAQQKTPNEQALISEMQAQQEAKLQCFSAFIARGAELEKALARVKELEAKYEPPKPEAKPAEK